MLAQMDGAAYPIHVGNDFFYSLALIGSGLNPLSWRREYGMRSLFSGISAVHPLTMYWGDALTASGSISQQNLVGLHDRYLSFSGANINATPSLTGPTWTTEATITGMQSAVSASWGTALKEIVVGGGNGHIARYDWVAKSAVGPVKTIGMTCVGVWWSARHGVYVSLHDTGPTLELRIWADTVLPVTVGTPVADAALTAGRRTRIRSRVLGANADPCEGEVVAWSLTGVGSLSAAASYTDAAGYAETYYSAPLDGAAASVTITAEVAI